MSSNGNGHTELSESMKYRLELYFAGKGRGFRYVATAKDLRDFGLSKDHIKAAILTGFLAFGEPGYMLSRKTLAEIGILERTQRGMNDDNAGQMPVYKSRIGAYMADLIDSRGLNGNHPITCNEVESAISKYHTRRLRGQGYFRLTSSGLFEITEKAVKRRIEGKEFY